METVNLSEIARMCRVTRLRVMRWREQQPGFPPPVGQTAGGPVFERAAVEAWLESETMPLLTRVPPRDEG